MTKAQAMKVLRGFINSLALKPVVVARGLHCCALCDGPIEIRSRYRNAGVGRRVHDSCFQAAAMAVNELERQRAGNAALAAHLERLATRSRVGAAVN